MGEGLGVGGAAQPGVPGVRSDGINTASLSLSLSLFIVLRCSTCLIIDLLPVCMLSFRDTSSGLAVGAGD